MKGFQFKGYFELKNLELLHQAPFINNTIRTFSRFYMAQTHSFQGHFFCQKWQVHLKLAFNNGKSARNWN